MRALVIVHEPGCEPVLVGDRLRERGFELTELLVVPAPGRSDDSPDFGEPADFDLVVAMGSVSSVNDEARWIGDELEFLRRADAAEVPILGICFGAQALAAALGGRVVRSERPQVGWFPFTPDVDCGLPAGPWMQWHYDRIEAPSDAVVLGRDDVCVQAFTIRRNLGVQFHPEVTPHHVAGWIDSGGAAELVELGIERESLLAETATIEPDVTVRTNQLVDWFLADVAKL